MKKPFLVRVKKVINSFPVSRVGRGWGGTIPRQEEAEITQDFSLSLWLP